MRLHLKITLWIVVIFLGVGGTSIYALLLFQRAAGLAQFETMARTLTETILHSLTTTMVNNNPTEMRQIIRHIERAPMIERVAIYAPDSRVWASSNPDEIGTLQPSTLLAQVIATGTPRTEERPEDSELVVFTPIPNREECRGCHTAGPRILGATVVSLDTAHVESHLRGSARLLTGLVGFTFLLALGTLSVLLGRFVLDPLSDIVATVKEISRGNYGARSSVQTSDELGMLAAAFNDMSGRIERYTRAQRARIEDLTRRLSTLTIFSRTLIEAPDLRAGLAEAAAVFMEIVGADACAIYGVDGGQATLLAGAGATSLLEATGARIVVRAAETGRALCYPVGPAEVCCEVVPPGAGLAVPVRTREQTFGGIIVARERPVAFEEADLTLFTTAAGHLATALENRRLFEELRDKERLRGELLARLIRAHEEERFRIARELHDEVSQSLTSLMMSLNAVEHEGATDPARLQRALGTIRTVAESTLEEVRKIVFALRPTLLDDLGLVPAVRHYARTLLEAQGIEVRFAAAGFGTGRLPSAVETTVFRVAQEAITNVARHAHARTVAISLTLEGGAVRLQVADDGVGFEAAALRASPDRRRLGIAGMEERVTLLGGRLEIASAPGRGTVVAMTVPVPAEAAA
ncbi:MAG: histidine kinase [Armatimonadota bacterium]|nr:histidine kinase [Armatimonadota bacterium]MDR7450502.1 histidine kinase [Armatimonadota bacterium]MDR7466364.1 histidine kinase [Armatimonadota bacterium]MDR7493086.1 histidine kinase [Armatimonadota bacterium]MDR7498157.1 histidine kinase [Armatimonadota bacterium]